MGASAGSRVCPCGARRWPRALQIGGRPSRAIIGARVVSDRTHHAGRIDDDGKERVHSSSARGADAPWRGSMREERAVAAGIGGQNASRCGVRWRAADPRRAPVVARAHPDQVTRGRRRLRDVFEGVQLALDERGAVVARGQLQPPPANSRPLSPSRARPSRRPRRCRSEVREREGNCGLITTERPRRR